MFGKSSRPGARKRRFAVAFSLGVLLGATAAWGATLRGVVIDAEGDPIAEARVSLSPSESVAERAGRILAGTLEPPVAASVETGPDGRFELEVASGIFWTVRVEAEERGGVEAHLIVVRDTIELPPVELPPGKEVAVRLQDTAGGPIADAPIFALRPGSDSGWEIWRPTMQHAVTDASGTARFVRDETDDLQLGAWWREHGLVVDRAFGGSLSISGDPSPPRRLRVVDDGGRPIEGAVVTHSDGWPLAITDERGQALLRFASRARAEIDIAHSESGRGSAWLAEIEGEELPEVVEVALVRARTVAGRVVDLDRGTPIAGAAVFRMGFLDGADPAESAADGSFRVLAGSEGPVRSIAAVAPGYTLGTAEVPNDEAPVTLGLLRAAGLEGRVVGPEGPVAGAEVELEVDWRRMARRTNFSAMAAARLGLQSERARTDERGRFALPDLAPGYSYTLAVRADALAEGSVEVAALAPGERRGPLEIVLTTGGRIAGSVVGPDGAPVPGAELEARRSTPGRPAIMIAFDDTDPIARAFADDAGRFVVPGIAPGAIDLTVRAAGFAPALRSQIELSAGVPELDVGVLELLAGAPVRGTVLGPAGTPLEGAFVVPLPGMYPAELAATFCMRGMSARLGQTTGADGAFELLDLDPGAPVTVVACREGYLPAKEAGVRPPTIEPLVLELSQPSSVAGRVVDPDGNGVPEAAIRYEPPGGRRIRTFRGQPTQADGEGRFLLEEVPGGAGTIVGSAAGWLDGRVSIEVAPGAELSDVEVVLQAGGLLTGRVVGPSGDPIEGARVSVSENRSRRTFRYSRNQSDADGRYRVEAVPFGRQTFQAEHEDFPSTSQTIEIEEGENTLDFQLEAGARVAGRVVDPQNAPIPGAEIYFSSGDDDRDTTTGADGTFEILNARIGAGRVSAHLDGRSSERREIEVGTPGAEQVVLELGGSGAIVGQLVGLDPAELSRVRVWAGSDGGSASGRSLGDGRYRVDGLSAGEWRVRGSLDSNSKLATGTVMVGEGGEAELDLDFASGFTLTGSVVDRSGPAGGVEISVAGLDVMGRFRSTTDSSGAFEIGNLEAGRYEVTAQSEAGQAIEQIDVSGDRSVRLELLGGVLTGSIRAADTGAPVPDARILAVAIGGEVRWRSSSRAQADSNGVFRMEGVSGEQRVEVTADGYAQAIETVRLSADGFETVDFELEPNAEIVLQVRGMEVGSLDVVLRDAAGRRVVEEHPGVTTDGLARLEHVPDGSWQLEVDASGAARVSVPLQAPRSQPVDVALVPEATLEISIPDLDGSSTVATLEITGGDGRKFEPSRYYETSWKVYRGERTIRHLPAGVWQIVATTSDGRRWTGAATTNPGATTEVELGGL